MWREEAVHLMVDRKQRKTGRGKARYALQRTHSL
jgi:hypothetical protein